MTAPRTTRLDLSWRRRNAAGLLACCILAVAAMMLWELPGQTPQSADLPVDDRKAAAAEEKIDPNTASLASLRRLPELGQTKAQAVIDYRSAHGPSAFRRAADMDNVRGIGPALTEKLRPFLALP